MTHLTDHELVSLYITTADDRYYSALYTRHYCRVYRRCLSYTESVFDSEDFAQDIFVRLADKLPAFKGDAQFTTWLHAITVNYCIDQNRKRQQEQLRYKMYFRDICAAQEVNPDSDRLQAGLVEKILDRLSRQQRELLLAKYKEGNQIKDIAEQQDLTPSAVKMRIKRARDRARYLYFKLQYQED
ncbi:RNA polymerase sigma factor [Spirosoma montaniterrae]|uniref:RNA polymerase subunit sigma-24 n=1 Tax=Spirosoma montaniterrae TaxID=1178516 RepID=A0A1P9WVM9_9BACT|nr:sigma-70 family RNA polymerase sigma factor [Spirosoma montaniterrae]AQG79434.1 hypothetical protein AWR27_08940 [Spirosoma montaniterrae]